uniref:Sp6 transcription factor n=1 Tax=Nothobranchius kuhntae TaxID=321403 RepID=A0A1A8IZA2_NOTKU
MAHPYEPWLRTTPSSGNSDEMNISSWWDLHRDVQAGSWIDLQTGQGVGLPSVSQGSSMGLQPSLGPYGSDPQLCTLPPVQHAPASHSSHLFPQDGFKMEPLGPDMLQQETFSLDEPQETSVSARPKPQRRSSSRGGGQAVCRCPNCAGIAATGHLSATGSSVARDDEMKQDLGIKLPGYMNPGLCRDTLRTANTSGNRTYTHNLADPSCQHYRLLVLKGTSSIEKLKI